MKQLMIKQEFLDYIKQGIKEFEIRKDPNLEGKVELVSVETGDKLKVRLKLAKHSTYKIISSINYLKGAYLPFEEDGEHFNKWKMYSVISNFLKDYWKNGEELYWYNLEIIKD